MLQIELYLLSKYFVYYSVIGLISISIFLYLNGTYPEGKIMSSEKTPLNTHVLEIPVPGKKGGKRRLEFQSCEDMHKWEKAYCKSKWLIPYFLVGVGINLVLYRIGVDLSRNLGLGFLVGVGIPLVTMFLCSELHYRLFYRKP